jgi:hypothetical protein
MTIVQNGTSNPVAVAPSGSANTKGSYVQLIASTSAASVGFWLTIFPAATSDQFWLLDIATGAPGAEVDIFANWMVQGIAFALNAVNVWVPLQISVGTAISARCQTSLAGGQSLNVQVFPESASAARGGGFTRCTTYGALTASSRGTTQTSQAVWGSTPTTFTLTNKGDAVIANVNNNQSSVGFGEIDIRAYVTNMATKTVIPQAAIVRNATGATGMIGPVATDALASDVVSVQLQGGAKDFDLAIYVFDGYGGASGAVLPIEDSILYDIQQQGTVSLIEEIYLRDTTGAYKTGLVFNTAGLKCYYSIDGNTPVAVTLATMTLNTYASGGFKEIDATNKPGAYQFCPPNLALASGSRVRFQFTGASLLGATLTVDLTGSSPRAAAATTAQTAQEVLLTLNMGRGNKVVDNGTSIVLYDTDGTTVLATKARTRSGTVQNPIISLG